MCEANAYMLIDGKEELLLEFVDILEPLDDGGFRLQNIFGDQKIVKADIHRMELVTHKIFFKEYGVQIPEEIETAEG